MKRLSKRTIELLKKHGFNEPLPGRMLESSVLDIIDSIALEFDEIMSPKCPKPAWKEPELMTLQDAIYKMSIGDTFKPIKEGLTALMMQKSGFLLNDSGNNLAMSVDVMKVEGQIMSARPKVLTAEEWVEKNNDKHGPMTDAAGVITFEAGDKNGQLKEWLNHKELREAAEDIARSEFDHDIGRLIRAIENLKPLDTK